MAPQRRPVRPPPARSILRRHPRRRNRQQAPRPRPDARPRRRRSWILRFRRRAITRLCLPRPGPRRFRSRPYHRRRQHYRRRTLHRASGLRTLLAQLFLERRRPALTPFGRLPRRTLPAPASPRRLCQPLRPGGRRLRTRTPPRQQSSGDPSKRHPRRTPSAAHLPLLRRPHLPLRRP